MRLNNKIIMSVYNKNNNLENNWHNHTKEVQLLKKEGIEVMTGIGSYMNDLEQCIILDDTMLNRQKYIYGLAGLYDQECIMYINNNYDCYLNYGYGSEHNDEYLGKLVMITEQESKNCTNWTKIGDEYYTTTK